MSPPKLKELPSVPALAALLAVDIQEFRKILSNPHRHYYCFDLRQEAKTRRVEASLDPLKAIQKKICRAVAQSESFPPYVCGGLPRRSPLDHAKFHVGRQTVCTCDIARCYPSTSDQILKVELIAQGYRPEIASAICSLGTFDGHLATGAPTSSYLLNIVWKRIDVEILRFLSNHGLTYSRYMDDLAISGDGDLSFVPGKITKIVARWGYNIKADKTRIMPRHRTQVVTGLVVNDVVRPTSEYRQTLKTLIRRCWEKDLDLIAYEEELPNARSLSQRIYGQVQFVKSVDRKVGREIESLCYRIPWPWKKRTSPAIDAVQTLSEG